MLKKNVPKKPRNGHKNRQATIKFKLNMRFVWSQNLLGIFEI